MKNIIIKYFGVAFMAIAISFVLFSCENEDENGNNSTSRLKAYGPNPALRGSELTFVGENLDRVTTVVFPDNITVDAIIRTEGDKGRFKVVVPQNAQPGIIKLLLAGGGELQTKGELTFTEPISIKSISPQLVKAGQTVTIEGDYLNLIQKVIFAEEVEVKCQQFTIWEREKIALVIPVEARSGIIILADTAEIPLELKSEIELQVVLPSVNEVLDLTGKKPGDVITIQGRDLDLVVRVEMPSGDEVPFTVENNTLKFTLPENISDGAIVMIPASGVRVAIANIGVAVPSELVATPNTGLRSGDEIKITGINIDLVTTVNFKGVEDAVTPLSKTATEIRVVMPENAQSGDLVLNTASGKTAKVTVSTLKPEVLAYNPNPVAAGNPVELQGRNLDLIASVTFGGNKKVEVAPTAADKLSVTVPVDAESGEPVLTMKNGETVECASLTIDKPTFCYIPVLPEDDVEINAGTVFVFDAKNTDKLTDVQVNGSSVQYIVEGEKLYVFIPNSAGGATKIKLISSNGEVEYTINVKGSGTKETIVYQGPVDLTWGSDGRAVVPASAFDGVGAGSKLVIYFTQKEAWGQAQINDGGWTQIPWPELDGSGTITTDTYKDKSVNVQEFVLTQDILTLLDSKKGIYGEWSTTEPAAIIIQGGDWIINKITIITSAPSETAVWQGNWTATWTGDDALRVYKADLTAAGLKAGKKLVFYYTSTGGGDAQLKIQDANWGAIAVDDPNYNSTYGTLTVDAAATSYEWTMTADIVNTIMTTDDGWSDTGLVLMGQNCSLSKITVK
jgi:hypothetical protein